MSSPTFLIHPDQAALCTGADGMLLPGFKVVASLLPPTPAHNRSLMQVRMTAADIRREAQAHIAGGACYPAHLSHDQASAMFRCAVDRPTHEALVAEALRIRLNAHADRGTELRRTRRAAWFTLKDALAAGEVRLPTDRDMRTWVDECSTFHEKAWDRLRTGPASGDGTTARTWF